MSGKSPLVSLCLFLYIGRCSNLSLFMSHFDNSYVAIEKPQDENFYEQSHVYTERLLLTHYTVNLQYMITIWCSIENFLSLQKCITSWHLAAILFYYHRIARQTLEDKKYCGLKRGEKWKWRTWCNFSYNFSS